MDLCVIPLSFSLRCFSSVTLFVLCTFKTLLGYWYVEVWNCLLLKSLIPKMHHYLICTTKCHCCTFDCKHLDLGSLEKCYFRVLGALCNSYGLLSIQNRFAHPLVHHISLVHFIENALLIFCYWFLFLVSRFTIWIRGHYRAPKHQIHLFLADELSKSASNSHCFDVSAN